MAVIQFLNLHGALILFVLTLVGTASDGIAKVLPAGRVQSFFKAFGHIGVALISAFKEATAVFIPPTNGGKQ